MASEKKPNLGKAIVIGGCGFLGHHVVNLLLERYTSEPSVIDLRCSVNRRPDSDGVNYFEADITDADKMLSIFQKVKPDVVIHTASPAVQATAKVADALFKKVNVDGTRVVVETCQKTGVKALVYTSSASILSNNKDDLINADERWPVIRGKDQTEYYSETKAEAEELVLKANRDGSHKLLTAAIRPSGIVGEGDKMVLYHMVNILREKRSHWQIGENNNMFDFTYVVNVAHAHLLAARALLHSSEANIMPLDHEKVDGEAFLITNDSPIYFWDFARVIWNEAGSEYGTDHVWVLPREVGLTLASLSELFYAIIRKSPTFTRQRVVYATMTRYYDISKAKRRLGYKPIVPLEDGLRRAVRWTLDQEKTAAIKK
ncbi:putative sterol-4-alpha-carboxylate 3-dehydrogenase protein [Phaeoacremonium minimum UCRPA7]|uniref:Sterol-4-alpha-carboxylate 3-dehydrogenase ERG26, decarboxylating n=1 Tax=Phaeoacremonium minimum (strain UCR-PA7) TaxID=1286976 RepID=R8BRZ0_PHAM7|nr:putative sterol-4-alpha-carboxylate 3-dehydrogenase protein [Phaeoacremonium minimum UCRPA7]EOO02089.1 putative sterol-4-alpha-carboxylate 3-dehydrogenase protein [Phaeoacremonium minimum UCRPA7]